MDRYRELVLRAALLCSMFGCASVMTAEIPFFTPALEEKLVHWQTPFVATYRKHATILQAIGSRKRVLVVYGQSHWVTLSAALQDKMGKPVIR